MMALTPFSHQPNYGNPYYRSINSYLFTAQDQPPLYRSPLWDEVDKIYPRSSKKALVIQKIAEDTMLAATSLTRGFGNFLYSLIGNEEPVNPEIPLKEKINLKKCQTRLIETSITLFSCAVSNQQMRDPVSNSLDYECALPEKAPLGSMFDFEKNTIYLSINNKKFLRSMLFQTIRYNLLQTDVFKFEGDMCSLTFEKYIFHSLRLDLATLNKLDSITVTCVSEGKWDKHHKIILIMRNKEQYYYECEHNGLNDLRRYVFRKLCSPSLQEQWDESAHSSQLMNAFLHNSSNFPAQ